MLAILTLLMTSFISIEEQSFKNIVIEFSVFSAIYYLIKSFVMIRKIKKEHKNKISDVRDIIKKGEE